jgi:hypothetical protein
MGCGGEEYRLWPRFHCPVTDYELYVFNRWGEVLFETNDLDEPWDPWTPNSYPGDVYVWRIIYKDMAGEEKELTGHVTILR